MLFWESKLIHKMRGKSKIQIAKEDIYIDPLFLILLSLT